MVEAKNSQTMDLLNGYLNINPTGVGGADLAIVDSTALAYEGDSDFYVDEGAGGGQISVYTVRKGDTLSSIAKMFNVSANTIIWANDLRGGKISIGQELVILPISGVKHAVKKGDTLASIAKKYKADLDDILSYNDISADKKLSIGDVIIVPDGEINVAQVQSTSRAGGLTGTVKEVKSVLGYFIRPVVGAVKSQGIHGRNGVDLAAPTGTPVVASADGVVVVARSSGYNGGYGLYVVVSHSNGTQTLYAHLSSVAVKVGQNVEQGQRIGAVGNTGKSTGSHLHIEVRGAKNPF